MRRLRTVGSLKGNFDTSLLVKEVEVSGVGSRLGLSTFSKDEFSDNNIVHVFDVNNHQDTSTNNG